MSKDEAKMLNSAMTALQDRSHELAKLNNIKGECISLGKYIQKVQEDYQDEIECTPSHKWLVCEKRVKEKTVILGKLTQESKKFNEFLSLHSSELTRVEDEHMSSIKKAEYICWQKFSEIMENMRKIREDRREEKIKEIEALKESKKAQDEMEGLMMIIRSITKTYLYPIEKATLRGIIKGPGGDQEFDIECSDITPRKLHESIWTMISKHRNNNL